MKGAVYLDKKEINFLIKQVRLDTGLKQKDARAGVMSAVSYSKMENGRKSLAFEELVSILANLQVSLEEFLIVYVQPVLTESARVKLIRLVDQLPSEDALNQIFSMFNEYVERFPDLSSDEMGVYFDVKALFHKKYPEKVPPVVHSEQKLAIERIMNKAQYKLFMMDYKIVAQIINDLDITDMKEIFKVLFPISPDTYLSSRTKQHIGNIFLNSITPMMKKKEYAWVNEMINIAEEHRFIYEDSFFYLSQLTYLKSVYEFFAKKDMLGLQKAHAIIEAIEVIGEKETAVKLRNELQDLLEDKKLMGYSMQDVVIGKS